MLDRQRRRRSRSSRTDSKADEPEVEQTPVLDQPPQRGLWLYLSVPVAGVLLSGTKEPWALGLLALLIGATALFLPPVKAAPRLVLLPMLAGLALSLAAFLPASWFGLPEWRVILERDYGISMASTLSPQPWITWESWMLLAVGVLWAACCLGRGFSSGERRRVLRFLSIFMALLACAAVAISYRKIDVPFWRAPWDIVFFGPFPNRNNFSGILAVGVLLALATTQDALRQKHRFWWVYALAIVPMFVAILSNTSRMGVLAVFLGCGAWVLTASLKHNSAKRAAVLMAMLLIMAAVVLLYGGPVLERIRGGNEGMLARLASDGRWKIFTDALDMIKSAPVFGTGLGNFEPVFALSRTGGELHSRPIHPENDWLWLGAEAGLPCLLLALLAAGALAAHFRLRRREGSAGRQQRRLRSAAGIGVLLLFVQGLVNTPLHAPGVLVFACLLAGVALPARGGEGESAPWKPALLHRMAGVLILSFGMLWCLTAAGRTSACGNSYYKQLAGQAGAMRAAGDLSGAAEVWREAARIKPLQWNIYYELATLKLQLGRSAAEALGDFSRWRGLERNSAVLCLREFDFWQDYSPMHGVPALREAMRRDPPSAADFYEIRMGSVLAHAELRPHFFAMAKDDPKLALAYLPHATAPEFTKLLDAVLAADPALQRFTAPQKLKFFQVWYQRGDAATLVSRLEEREDWRRDGWSVLAAHKAREGNFRRAFEIALNHVPKPLKTNSRSSGAVADLLRDFNNNPGDLMAGFDLYEAQKRISRHQDALATLDKLIATPQVPTRVYYEKALTLAETGDYPRAWEAIQEYHGKIVNTR